MSGERTLVYPFQETWAYTEIMNGLDGAILGCDGFENPCRRAMSASRIAARHKELRRSPVSILIHALSRADSFLRLMDQTIHGRRQVVVSFNDNTQLVLLAIDAETRLLTKVVFVEDDPLYGDVQNEVFFSDWRQVGKLKLPFERIYRIDGQTIMAEHVEAFRTMLICRPWTLPFQTRSSTRKSGTEHAENRARTGCCVRLLRADRSICPLHRSRYVTWPQA